VLFVTIVQGDNGIIVPFVTAKPSVINLEGAIVEVSIKRGSDLLTKPATILDKIKGKCQFELSNFDLTMTGTYFYQWTAKFENGRILNGRRQEFYVSDKLAGVKPVIDAGMFTEYNPTVTYDGGGF
jgi:hypothetical protein